MTVDGWDPAQYDRFQDQRRQPFFDLLALIRPHPGARAADLGCGTGELTPLLHAHVGAADTLGIDNSATMLAKADRYAGDGVHFEPGDIAEFHGSGYDVVFANASLHWVPDHAALLDRLRDGLGPGGQLAFQVPANFDHPSHAVAAEIASESPFVEVLGEDRNGASRSVLAPEEYTVLLNDLGFATQHVRLQVYGHLLDSSAEVVEWVKGTTLTAYRRRLPAPMYDEFLAAYRARFIQRAGDQRPYFYPFKRILAWAELPE